MKPEELKLVVRDKYSQIASQSGNTSCCGPSYDCCGVDYTIFSENYTLLKGYNPDADLRLGCGTPTEFAGIQEDQHVLDLGSGAGNDCFVARAIVGEKGRVIGLDFSAEMLVKAKNNAQKLDFQNIEFVEGDIEDMPLASNQFDVVISNCVLNLVPDKTKAFSEIKRVLKPGGHFCVSDVVIKGQLPEQLQSDAEMYAGCVSGAIQMEDYLNIIRSAGFEKITVHKQRTIDIPQDTLKKSLSDKEIKGFQDGSTGIISITISGWTVI
ncbi:arsenite methyltransferase [Natronoflexus pectinivorans]|uniref:Arsenite methyltransferase n=1 Tax=Natronoflexus pectinivorans TaxID=682526 RepID=A0A4R2GLM4_9BACT|nr:arsenite methyltransferase [Natronoflexus pectinivorans]TCO08391.1 methyltransferase family protein [Natronoflexus pectinivorans]